MKKLLIGFVILFVTVSAYSVGQLIVETPKGLEALAKIIQTVSKTNPAGEAAIAALGKAYGVGASAAALAKIPEVQKLFLGFEQIEKNAKTGTVTSAFSTNDQLTEKISRAVQRKLMNDLKASSKEKDVLAKVCNTGEEFGGQLGASIRAIAEAQAKVQQEQFTVAFSKAKLTGKEAKNLLIQKRQISQLIAKLEANGAKADRITTLREKLASINSKLKPLGEEELKLATREYVKAIIKAQNPGKDPNVVYESMVAQLSEDFANAEIPADVRAHLKSLGLETSEDMALATFDGVGHHIIAEWLPGGGKLKEVGIPGLAVYSESTLKVIQGTQNWFNAEYFFSLTPETRVKSGACPIGAAARI